MRVAARGGGVVGPPVDEPPPFDDRAKEGTEESDVTLLRFVTRLLRLSRAEGGAEYSTALEAGREERRRSSGEGASECRWVEGGLIPFEPADIPESREIRLRAAGEVTAEAGRA